MQKLCFATSPIWQYGFSGFSEISSILETLFFAKTRRDTKKHKIMMGAAPEIYFALFPKPDFDLHVANLRPTMEKKPVFPQFWSFLHFAKRKAGFTPYPTQKHMPYVKRKNVR